MKVILFDKKDKKLNMKKVVKVAIAVLVIALIVTICILYSKNKNVRNFLDKYLFRKEAHENNLPFIEIDPSKIVGLYAYDKYIVILEDGKVKIYNKLGKEETEIDVEITSPIFESNGNNLIIAEKNGQKIYLINGKNISWQKDIEGKIAAMNVNRNGYISLIIHGTSYKTVIKTYDPSGNELFTKYLATANVVDTDISNDNKYLAIAEANVSGIVVQSIIEIISIDAAKSNNGDSIKYTHVANSGDLITNIEYQNKNQLVCMYDEHIDILHDDKNEELLNFKNENVLFGDIDFDSKVMKIIKKSTGIFGSESELQIVDTGSKFESKYEIESVPKDIKVKDNLIVVNLGTSALFIKDTGWLLKKYESSHEIQDILICDEMAGIVSKDKIELITF